MVIKKMLQLNKIREKRNLTQRSRHIKVMSRQRAQSVVIKLISRYQISQTLHNTSNITVQYICNIVKL